MIIFLFSKVVREVELMKERLEEGMTGETHQSKAMSSSGRGEERLEKSQ